MRLPTPDEAWLLASPIARASPVAPVSPESPLVASA